MSHVLCSILEFDDGSISAIELHRGTMRSCQELAERIPAVCNSTGRIATAAYLAITTAGVFDAATSAVAPPLADFPRENTDVDVVGPVRQNDGH